MVNNSLENDVHHNVEPIGDNIVPEDCSICMEPLDATRTVIKLQCGHEFHLDCIGSVFNVKKKMECSLCRNIEPGRWLYAAGGGSQDPPHVNIARRRQVNGGLGPQLPLVILRGEPAVRSSFVFRATEAGSDPFLNNHYGLPARSSFGLRATEAGSDPFLLNNHYEPPVRSSFSYGASAAGSDPVLLSNHYAWSDELRTMQRQIDRSFAEMDHLRSLSNMVFGGPGGSGEGGASGSG